MIKLGQRVKEKVTGYEGIAVSATVFLQGCRRIEVQAPANKDGTVPDAYAFDEPLLEVIDNGILEEEPDEDTGGPHSGRNPRRGLGYGVK